MCKVVFQSKDGNWFYRHSEPVWCMMSHHYKLTCNALPLSNDQKLSTYGFVLVEVNLIVGRVSSIEFGV